MSISAVLLPAIVCEAKATVAMALGRETYVHTSPFVLPPRWKPEVGHWRQRVFQPVGVSAARRSPLAAHVSTANTASTVENKTASSNPVAADASSAACREESSGVLTVTSESLRLLEWPALCRQAAAFCEIPLAAQQLLRDGLRLGRSQVEQLFCLRNSSIQALEALATCPLLLAARSHQVVLCPKGSGA